MICVMTGNSVAEQATLSDDVSTEFIPKMRMYLCYDKNVSQSKCKTASLI